MASCDPLREISETCPHVARPWREVYQDSGIGAWRGRWKRVAKVAPVTRNHSDSGSKRTTSYAACSETWNACERVWPAAESSRRYSPGRSSASVTPSIPAPGSSHLATSAIPRESKTVSFAGSTLAESLVKARPVRSTLGSAKLVHCDAAEKAEGTAWKIELGPPGKIGAPARQAGPLRITSCRRAGCGRSVLPGRRDERGAGGGPSRPRP